MEQMDRGDMAQTESQRKDLLRKQWNNIFNIIMFTHKQKKMNKVV